MIWGSAERKMSTKCIAKNNCSGEPEDSSTQGGFIQACQQEAGCIRWFLGLFSFIRWKDTFVMSTHKKIVCPVSFTKTYKSSRIWGKGKTYIRYIFLFTLLIFIFIFRLFRRKEMLICLSWLKSLWWLWRSCDLPKKLHLPLCSNCFY